MDQYHERIKNIPWKSFGRETVAFRVGRCLAPVGISPVKIPTPLPNQNIPLVDSSKPNFEEFLMNIVGTGIHSGNGKLVTCLHVVDSLFQTAPKGYILARSYHDNAYECAYFPIIRAIRYIDFRTDKVNRDIDVAVIVCAPPENTGMSDIEWGDSTEVGVGDAVLIGGYPYGKAMFQFTKSNRGIVQPTYYQGVISAILPAKNASEIRMFQIGAACAGGMSGGAVFNPETGKCIGMVTSGINIKVSPGDPSAPSIPQPITYAIPSEIIAPYVESISFKFVQN